MSDTLRRYSLALFCVALLFVLLPIVDALTNVWPWSPTSEQWRFGALAVFSNYLISPIFGIAMAGALAAALESRGGLRTVGVLAGLGTVVLVVLSFSYGLDTLQVRSVVREDQMEMFKIGAAKTILKLSLSTVTFLLLAIASFKAANQAGAAGSSRR